MVMVSSANAGVAAKAAAAASKYSRFMILRFMMILPGRLAGRDDAMLIRRGGSLGLLLLWRSFCSDQLRIAHCRTKSYLIEGGDAAHSALCFTDFAALPKVAAAARKMRQSAASVSSSGGACSSCARWCSGFLVRVRL